MLEILCLNKRKNKSAKFSENLNALSILLKKPLILGAKASIRICCLILGVQVLYIASVSFLCLGMQLNNKGYSVCAANRSKTFAMEV
jgi:hypothetical protein